MRTVVLSPPECLSVLAIFAVAQDISSAIRGEGSHNSLPGCANLDYDSQHIPEIPCASVLAIVPSRYLRLLTLCLADPTLGLGFRRYRLLLRMKYLGLWLGRP